MSILAVLQCLFTGGCLITLLAILKAVWGLQWPQAPEKEAPIDPPKVIVAPKPETSSLTDTDHIVRPKTPAQLRMEEEKKLRDISNGCSN